MKKAILFGSIGTLIETSDIQRESFNESFKETGLDWYWDEEDYIEIIKKIWRYKENRRFCRTK